jgi:methanogenic corrinoid protein MtbC1
MLTSPEYLLERIAHHVLGGNSRQAHLLMGEARRAGAPAAALIAEVVFPTIECVQQLRHEGGMTARAANGAARTLTGLLHGLVAEAPREPALDRTVLVLAGPGHRDELGASAAAALAEVYGFEVFFAGGGLSMEEVAFAAGQLMPEVLLIHAGLPAEREAVRGLVKRCQEVGLWPRSQIAVTGAAVTEKDGMGADVASSTPLAALELLALCPEYRVERAGARVAAKAVTPLEGLEIGVSAAEVKALLSRRLHLN